MWSHIPISFRIFHSFFVIHTLKGFGIVNKTEIDMFLELSCFFDDPADVGNLIFGSSAFSKTSWNIWKFMVHVLLKPGLENFKHYLTTVWDGCNYAIVWAFLGIAVLWDWNENWPFPVLWPLLSFPNLLAYWVQHFHITFTSLFRIWNSSTGIPSSPLALFIVMLPKAHLTSHSRTSGSWWVITQSYYLSCKDLFCTVLLCILATLLNMLCFCLVPTISVLWMCGS